MTLLLGAAMVGGSGCGEPPTDVAGSHDETWIEAHVELDEAVAPVRVMALATDGSSHFASASVETSGAYRVGPLPAGEYELVALSWTDGAARVHNYPSATVTTATDEVAYAALAQPGEGELDVTFAGPRPPGTMVTAVTVFDGLQGIDDIEAHDALYARGAYWRRSRNTVSAEDPSTRFDGLEPGRYTACAKVNVGGTDLEVICQAVDVGTTERATVTLDPGRLVQQLSA